MSALQAAGLRLPGGLGSIRFRIAALTAAVLFALAGVVVGTLYLGLSLTLDHSETRGDLYLESLVPGENGALFGTKTFVLSDVENLDRRVNARTLGTMRNVSLGALAALFVVSLGVGWVVAGRVLRPIDRIAAVAQEIQATNLSRRIDLKGPDDELKRLADTFDAMLARLDSAFSAQRRFVADASHELRNPLAIMRTSLDVALREPDAGSDVLRSHASVALRATDRMAGVVGDLLAVGRLEAPASPRHEVDLEAVAVEVSDEFGVLAEQRRLDIVRRLDGDLRVDGDRDALKRALANLVDNAVQLAPEGSRIDVVGSRSNGWVTLAVVDGGPGIAPEDQPRVFDRLWRADRSRPGSGLGLAVVKQVVEAHGGRVALRSAPGSGSTFELAIPAVP